MKKRRTLRKECFFGCRRHFEKEIAQDVEQPHKKKKGPQVEKKFLCSPAKKEAEGREIYQGSSNNTTDDEGKIRGKDLIHALLKLEGEEEGSAVPKGRKNV